MSKYKAAKNDTKEPLGISYLWKQKEIAALQERLDLPQDPQQIPDLIVSLYSKKKRIAYIRIPYHT